MRPTAATMSSSDMRPLSTMRCMDFEQAAATFSAFSLLRPRTTTSKPALAQTSAMPDAIVPVPTTPIVDQPAMRSWSAGSRASSDGRARELPGSS